MNENKLPVVFVTDGIFPHSVGGMQKHSKLLVEALAKSNQLNLVVIHPHVGTKVFEENLHIVEHAIPAPKHSIQYIIDGYRYSQKVAFILKKYPNAIIYSQGFSVWSEISKFKNRLIVNPHGLEAYQTMSNTDYYKTTPFRLVFNYIFKRSAYVVSLGGKLTDIIKSCLSKDNQVVVLPNATNITDFPNKDFNGNVTKVLFVGRFAFNKGIDVLIKCIQKINNENLGHKYKFCLVGKGPLYDHYKSLYTADNLTYYGFASDDDLDMLYKTSHVFVLPTLFEGMPTVVLEAMAKKMPIIVTDVGATLELVDKSNGIIIEKKSVESLFDALKMFHQLPESVKTNLAEASYKRVKDNFTWPVIAQKHIDLFNQIAKKINA